MANSDTWLSIRRDPVVFSDDDSGVQSPSLVFRFHCHSQKVIGSLGYVSYNIFGFQKPRDIIVQIPIKKATLKPTLQKKSLKLPETKTPTTPQKNNDVFQTTICPTKKNKSHRSIKKKTYRPKGLIFSEGSTLAAMKVKGSVKPRCFDDGTNGLGWMVGWDGWVLFVGRVFFFFFRAIFSGLGTWFKIKMIYDEKSLRGWS